jgi:hypothetical protein
VGDTNFDGFAEIIAGDSVTGVNISFRILDSHGSITDTIAAFTKSYGVRVSVGNLGY